jgi:4-oxalocrotonate tautomerase
MAAGSSPAKSSSDTSLEKSRIEQAALDQCPLRFIAAKPNLVPVTELHRARRLVVGDMLLNFKLKLLIKLYITVVEAMNVPTQDRFQVITEYPSDGLIYDPTYLGIERSDDIVFIQITLNAGRTVDQKRTFYRRTAQLLGKEPGVRPEDVLINLVEVAKENWSFGNGEAPYAT